MNVLHRDPDGQAHDSKGDSAALRLLTETGLLPDSTAHAAATRREPSACVASIGRQGNLLPALADIWHQTAATASGVRVRGKAERMAGWIDQLQQRGAHLTVGLPTHGEPASRWLGTRLALWPTGIPRGRLVGVASSRLGRQLESQTDWFTMLRAACQKIDRARDVLVTATSTAAAPYVDRAAELFGLQLLRIEMPARDDSSLATWAKKIALREFDDQRPDVSRLLLSPPLAKLEQSDDDLLSPIAAPARDRALVSLSDQLLAFHVRRGGHLVGLLRARLADRAWPPGSVFVALGPQLVAAEVASELMDAGAVGWVVATIAEDDQKQQARPATLDPPTARKSPVRPTSARTASIIAMPDANRWNYLTHCTRRQNGPWPEQSEGEYLDDLILQQPDADHSALATLTRIVTTRRLVASPRAIRGGTAVVSFTATPLARLNQLQVFRPHRGRWDFQPYGICIRRDWLERQGARAVQYGNQQLWTSLSPTDQPFFQIHSSAGKRTGTSIDWSVEQEWRHVGDLELGALPEDAALIFVPSGEEAERLGAESPWPIVIVG